MEVLSALRVTSLTSKFPGVRATAAPPVTAIEYRWFQPFCSEANTIRFPTTKRRDASAVNRGNDPFSSVVLCQILRALPAVTSATHNAHGTGVIGMSGCFSFNPGARMKTICLPSSDQRGKESRSTLGARKRTVSRPTLLARRLHAATRVGQVARPVRLAAPGEDHCLAVRGDSQAGHLYAVVIRVLCHLPRSELGRARHPDIAHASLVEDPRQSPAIFGSHKLRRKRRAHDLFQRVPPPRRRGG